MAVDEEKLNAFLGKALGDLGASMSAALILVGDELGLYSALAEERLTSAELAERTGTTERYVREWLANQAAGGYVEYDSENEKYYLSEEQALCLANPNGPMDLPGGYSVVEDLFHVKQQAVENFRSGAGMEWGEHHRCLFQGTERFFRAGYNANLVSAWLPALDGVVEKLKAGGRVADIGCGHGVTTILMAQTFRTRSSSASTITTHRSRPPASMPRKRASPTQVSRWPTRRRIRAAATTSSPFSTVCTTWRILPAPPVTRGRRSIPMGTACLSSLSRGIASRTTSIP